MTNLTRTLLLALASLATATAQTLEPGYAAVPQNLPTGTNHALYLPDQDAVVTFDGIALILDDGVAPRTLLSFNSFTFGSFIRRIDAQHLLFGESSNGDLWLVDLVGGGTRVVANLTLNYDALSWRPGQVLVSAKTGGFSAPDNEVFVVDLARGTTDLVARLPGASGPLARDRGGVLYATAPAAFPTPRGTVDVLFFRDAQIAGAIGPGHLVAHDAHLVHGGLDAASAIALDADGDLFFVDWLNGTIGELSRHPGLHDRISVLSTYPTNGASAAALQFLGGRGTAASFEPFQPSGAGALLALEVDYATSGAVLRRIEPQRAQLTVAPPSPVPTGAFTLAVRDATPGGLAVIAFGLELGGRETPLDLGSFEQLLFWDPDLFTAFESVLLHLDAHGSAHITLHNPGLGRAFRFVAQAAFVDGSAVVIGSTAPLAITLQ